MRTKTDKRQIEYVAIDKLTPYARNSRTHSPQQVKQIAASIKEFGFTNPVLIDEGNGIIAGHGRVMAAEHLQLTEVPCIRLEYLTEIQKKAYVIADNKLALNAGWSEEMLSLELADLNAVGFEMSLLGFESEELVEAMNMLDVEGNNYTRKIEPPIYEPKGERPSIKELYDRSKTDRLIAEINECDDLDKDIAQMLRDAAERHTIFHFGKVAEYYCHASPNVQRLMENSAMVIIDYNKAVEQGFVKMTADFASYHRQEYGGDDAE